MIIRHVRYICGCYTTGTPVYTLCPVHNKAILEEWFEERFEEADNA